MNKVFFVIFLVSFSLSCQSGRASRVGAQENPKTPGINQKNEARKIENYINLFDHRIVKDSFKEKDFTVARRLKASGDSSDKSRTVEYAILQKGGKNMAKFDRLDHPLSSIDFGLFGFLGGKRRQIFVSQTAPRAGLHWIIETEPQFRVLFNNEEFAVGREDFNAINLDADSVYELSFESTAFYGFEPERLGNVGVPLTEIVFKYDPQRGKFLPANPQFPDFVLRDADAEILRIRRDNKDWQLADVLAIALRYVYAGKETQGWQFFDREYDFNDRDELKAKITAVLKNDPVYQYIYKRQ